MSGSSHPRRGIPIPTSRPVGRFYRYIRCLALKKDNLGYKLIMSTPNSPDKVVKMASGKKITRRRDKISCIECNRRKVKVSGGRAVASGLEVTSA